MRRQILLSLLLALSLFSTSVAQDRVLAQAQGYQLQESHLVPGVAFLTFLVQDQLSQQELNYLVQSSVNEFQTNPAEFLSSLQGMNSSIMRAQTIQDPLLLGEFRAAMIGEFYAATAQMPTQQVPPFLQVLFQRVPVVAFDPQSKVALTRYDLQASMQYLRELYAYQGTNLSEQELVNLGNQLAAGFTNLDKKTQNFLASGAVVLNVFRANVAQMTQAQQQALAQSYQQQSYQQQQPAAYQNTGGGSQSVAAKQWENWHNQQSMRIMQETMDSNHVTMMNVIEGMGGSDNYWTLEPVNY